MAGRRGYRNSVARSVLLPPLSKRLRSFCLAWRGFISGRSRLATGRNARTAPLAAWRVLLLSSRCWCATLYLLFLAIPPVLSSSLYVHLRLPNAFCPNTWCWHGIPAAGRIRGSGSGLGSSGQHAAVFCDNAFFRTHPHYTCAAAPSLLLLFALDCTDVGRCCAVICARTTFTTRGVPAPCSPSLFSGATPASSEQLNLDGRWRVVPDKVVVVGMVLGLVTCLFVFWLWFLAYYADAAVVVDAGRPSEESICKTARYWRFSALRGALATGTANGVEQTLVGLLSAALVQTEYSSDAPTACLLLSY